MWTTGGGAMVSDPEGLHLRGKRLHYASGDLRCNRFLFAISSREAKAAQEVSHAQASRSRLLDIPRRLRRRSRPGPGQPPGCRRLGQSQVGIPHTHLPADVRTGGRLDRHRRRDRGQGLRQHRRLDHGPQHVRAGARSLARRRLEGLVGRQPALSLRGLRADQPPARLVRDGRRHHLPLRHRRHPRRAGARQGRRATAATSASAAAPPPSGNI